MGTYLLAVLMVPRKISQTSGKKNQPKIVSKKNKTVQPGNKNNLNKITAKTIVLIPTYNERENIVTILAKLRELYPSLMIMVIDDSSPDGTAGAVAKIASKDKKIYLLDKGTKQGIGKAYIRGFHKVFELAKKIPIEYVGQMDADFSHSPEYLKKLLTKIIDNDLVIGSRYFNGVNVVNWPMKRVLLSYFANQYVNFITRLDIQDITGGFKVFRLATLEQINFDRVVSNGYVFQIEINFIFKKLGFRVAEVPIIFYDRQRGVSKIDFQIIREAMIKVLLFPFKNLIRYKKH